MVFVLVVLGILVTLALAGLYMSHQMKSFDDEQRDTRLNNHFKSLQALQTHNTAFAAQLAQINPEATDAKLRALDQALVLRQDQKCADLLTIITSQQKQLLELTEQLTGLKDRERRLSTNVDYLLKGRVELAQTSKDLEANLKTFAKRVEEALAGFDKNTEKDEDQAFLEMSQRTSEAQRAAKFAATKFMETELSHGGRGYTVLLSQLKHDLKKKERINITLDGKLDPKEVAKMERGFSKRLKDLKARETYAKKAFQKARK